MIGAVSHRRRHCLDIARTWSFGGENAVVRIVNSVTVDYISEGECEPLTGLPDRKQGRQRPKQDKKLSGVWYSSTQ